MDERIGRWMQEERGARVHECCGPRPTFGAVVPEFSAGGEMRRPATRAAGDRNRSEKSTAAAANESDGILRRDGRITPETHGSEDEIGEGGK
jgi:hypothetical protein